MPEDTVATEAQPRAVSTEAPTYPKEITKTVIFEASDSRDVDYYNTDFADDFKEAALEFAWGVKSIS